MHEICHGLSVCDIQLAFSEMGGWESIEMVRRYAHLAPNHLTEHARQIDSVLNPSVPNLSQSKNKEGTNDV
ncbi:hypothetical protein EYZ60_24745 [Escherichia coli]|nr:hypothetical protein [Escherichia coli]EEY6118875.1 hypothetical protein [Escherichia coli]EFA4874853.1 hypothetical protein [Escherichia coli]EFA4875714.1 hypothetical protein [Escherichia coli]EFG3867647.1 hypothetical protein [Escherichia coli]